MSKYMIKITVFIVAIIFLNVVRVAAQSDADKLRALFGDECLVACFMGIEPGVTTLEEVETRLQQENILYIKNILGEITIIEWEMQQHEFLTYRQKPTLLVSFLDGIALKIIAPLNAPITAVIEVFGNPNYVTDEEGRFTLTYPQHGLTFVIETSISTEETFVIYGDALGNPNAEFIVLAGEPITQSCTTFGVPPCIAPTATPTLTPSPTLTPTWTPSPTLGPTATLMSPAELATVFPLPMQPDPTYGAVRLSGDLQFVERNAPETRPNLCSRDANPTLLEGSPGSYPLISSANAQLWLSDTDGDNADLGNFSVIRIRIQDLPIEVRNRILEGFTEAASGTINGTPMPPTLVPPAIPTLISAASITNDSVGWIYIAYAHQETVSLATPAAFAYTPLNKTQIIGTSGNTGIESNSKHLDVSTLYVSGSINIPNIPIIPTLEAQIELDNAWLGHDLWITKLGLA